MKRLLRVVILAACAVPAVAQVHSALRPEPGNLNFEEGVVGEAPPAWLTPTPGFAAKTVEGGASGSKAALLAAVGGAPNAASFGNLMQSVDATAYRGKWVRLRATLKLGPNASDRTRAQLWFRVDRAGGRQGFFDNMMDRPVRAKVWTAVEIAGDVAEDATSLNFGLLMTGGGEALIDDVAIVVGPKVETHVEPPRALTPRGLANLTAFARLFGYVRHFHPSDQAAAANWNTVAIDGVRAIEGATDAADLAKKLDAFFHPLAPTVSVGTGFSLSRDGLKPVPTEGLQIVTWHHAGFGQGKPPYRSERVRKDAPPVLPPPFEADLDGGVSARIPLAVFADTSGTLPKVDRPAAEAAAATPMKFTGDDRATRLADVILLWNVLQHFYPYFDVVKTDWLAVLPAALKSAATDANETAFLRTMRTMMAELHDGHGQLYGPGEARGWSLPLLFGWIDDKLVVTQTTDASSELRPGDVIERIDGKPAKQALAEEEALVSAATPQYRRWTALQRMRDGAKDSEVKLDVRRGEETKPITVRRSVESSAVDETRPAKIAELEPGVFYIDLGRITDADFNGALQKLAAARGVIFDLRGYPSCSPAFLPHLIDTPIQSARWNVPIVTRPDHGLVDEYDTGGRWNLQPEAPRLRGKIVFLTDGRAISYAESIMGIIEAYKIAAIVGEPTAGTNGNINPLELPGGYRVFWTGMKVLKHDGSQHHGVGIQPTVRVSPTLRGVAEKRDEQLEAAVRIAKGD